jgi:hypothetical protein
MAKASLERSKLFDKETYAKNFFAAIEKNSNIIVNQIVEL